MERGASPLLAVRSGEHGRGRQAPTVQDLRAPWIAEAPRRERVRRRWLRRLLFGFCDSCALAGVALLACAAVIAVGTLGSLLWMFLLER